MGVPVSVERARSLRKTAPGPERAMWRLLYSLRREGHNFRRQVPLGRYYADFACHSLKLVIEIDGDTHGGDEAIAYDAVRDAFLRSEGYAVMRFTNDDVMRNAEGVFRVLSDWIAEAAKPPTPVPSPRGGGRPRLDRLVAAETKR